MPMGEPSDAARRNSCVAFSNWPFSCKRIPFCTHRSCRSAASCSWSVSSITAERGWIGGGVVCANKTVESARRISAVVVVLLVGGDDGCFCFSWWWWWWWWWGWNTIEIRLTFFKSCEARPPLLLYLLLLSFLWTWREIYYPCFRSGNPNNGAATAILSLLPAFVFAADHVPSPMYKI